MATIIERQKADRFTLKAQMQALVEVAGLDDVVLGMGTLDKNPPTPDVVNDNKIVAECSRVDVSYWDWPCENGAQTHQRRDG